MTPADYAAAFVAGARWWAEREGQALDAISADASADSRASRFGSSPADSWGTWPADYVGRAFVDGARWQGFHATGGTMWPLDQGVAEEEAERRYPIEAQP